MTPRETIDIEALLDWAYRVECVDRRSRRTAVRGPVMVNPYAGLAEMAALGTRVDTSGFQPADILTARVDDASLVHDAVLRLGEMWLEWRGVDEVEVWDHRLAAQRGRVIEQQGGDWLLVDCLGQGGLEPASVRLEQAGVAVLLIVHAKGGVRPDVHADWVAPVGAAVPKDGARRDSRGRIRRSAEGVSAAEVMHARALYTVWHAALGVLALELNGVLQRFAVSGPAAPPAPWDAVRRKVLKQASLPTSNNP